MQMCTIKLYIHQLADLLWCVFRLSGRHINWEGEHPVQDVTLLEEVGEQGGRP